MAHIFYADKKIENKNQSKDKKTNWAESQWYVFYFLKKWIKYRIFKFFNWVPSRFSRGWAGFLGEVFIGFSKSNRKKVELSFKALFPNNLSKKRLNQLYKAHCRYMGQLVVDFMSGLPQRVNIPQKKFVIFKNKDRLVEALSHKKGVIIPFTHIGQFINVPVAIAKDINNYSVATIAFIPNIATYEFTNGPWAKNVYLYASTKYSKISKHLENHLKKNHIVLMNHDYSSKNQLRVPFWQKKYPYLLHTPQSAIKLHKDTGAPILPCVNLPNGTINKTILKFLDNTKLLEISEKYQSGDQKQFHGRMSLELNSLINPYICQYAHVWEEITDFASIRIADKLRLHPNITIKEFLIQLQTKINNIIKGSYEPDRKDDIILNNIDKYFIQAISMLYNKDTLFCPHKTRINLSMMNGISEIYKLIEIGISELNKREEIQSSEMLKRLRNILKN